MGSAFRMFFLAMTLLLWRTEASSVHIVRMKGHPVASLVEKPAYAIKEEDDHESRAFVELHTTELIQSHDELLGSLLEEGSYTKLYSYTYLLNGFAVELKDNFQVESLRAHPQVLSLENEVHFRKATTYTPAFLGLYPGGWKTVGGLDQAGEGVVIGVLDTGIDPQHPSFANNSDNPYSSNRHWERICEVSKSFPRGSCNGKIVGARHFSKGIIAANAFNASNDYDSPLDGDGHGTHTSSVSAGNSGVYVVVDKYIYGRASGMAPRARLAVYKVIYRDGGYLSDVLAGIDQAVQDGVHILSISLGSTSGAYGVPFLNSFDIMMLLAFKAKVLVVHAAGNNGPSAFSMNSFGPWVLSVAAGLTDRTYSTPIILGSGQWVHGAGLTAATNGRNMYPLIYSEDAYVSGVSSFDAEFYSYCPDALAFNKSLIAGKILICNFVEYFSGGAIAQVQSALATAQATGAAGLLVVFPGSDKTQAKDMVFDPFPFTIPASFVIDSNSSSMIMKHYNEKTVKDNKGRVLRFDAHARIEDSRRALFPLEAPRVASYSSRGPVYADTVSSLVADVMKPDILAPGSQIWGAWTPKGVDTNSFTGRNFALLSGTSMATPHIAGIAALLRQMYPRWSVASIRSALMTTADNFDNRERATRAETPYSNSSLAVGRACPFDMGSGSVNATSALDPGLVFDVGFQDYVNFLCEIPGADQNSVEYSTGARCQRDAIANPSDLNMPYIAVANLIGSRVVRRRLLNLAGEETYNVTVRHPAGVDVSVRPRVFRARTGKPVDVNVTLTATQTNQQFTFGYMYWSGDRGHTVRIPLLVSANSMSG